MTPRFLFLPALALALVLTGCDAVGDTSSSATAEDLEDAAGAIAEAVALDAGGALDDAASMSVALGTDASLSGDGDDMPDRPGCDASRTYDDSGTWNVSIACERGNPDGRFYHAFAREATWRFLDADGNPQEGARGATTIEHDLLSGTGTHLTPRASAVLESLTSSITIETAGEDLVTVNGTYDRDGIHTVFGRGEAQREVDFDLSLTMEDITGPRGRRDRWAGAVSGTLSGVYTATVTATAPNGDTRTREVEREFTVTFPNEAERRARIAVGDRVYDADPVTGELL
ncbi:MAG: hypothetical protein AAGI52_11895 [Bacteroidota bacterium]